MGSRILAFLFALGALLGACATRAAAQSFLDGRVPADVDVVVIERPYTIRGDTPDEIYRQLQIVGLGGVWARFRYTYIWHYGSADQGYTFVDGRSGRCRIPDFRADLRLTMEFPEWQRPADPSPALVEAWDAFHALVLRDWEERRDAVYRMLTEYNRVARRYEANCPLLQTELEVLGDRLETEMVRTEDAARERGQRVSLQWPPPGFETRFARITPGTVQAGGIELRPDRSRPVLDRERLLADAQFERARTSGEGWLVVAGLRHEGQPVYFAEAISQAPAGGVPIDPATRRPYPGLTELFVSTLAAALDSAGVLDLHLPISEYLRDIDPVVGQATLAQLLSHRSGLDNARPDSTRGLDWTTAARVLPAHARFTEPGAIYSYSGYDFPLAVRTIETVVGRDIGAALGAAIFAPLGMTGTSLGLSSSGAIPVTSTTPDDVMYFVSQWVEGGIRGAPPLALDPGSELASPGGGRTYAWGVWYDEVGGVARVSLACQAGGFRLFGATRTAFSLWTSGRFPSATWHYLLDGVGEQLGIRADILRAVTVAGTGTLNAVEPTCREPSVLREMVLDAGDLAPSGSWPGDYRNGDQIMRLTDEGGFLSVTNGQQPMDVTHYAGEVYFTSVGGQVFFPMRLTTDAAGRRYLVLDGRAFIHADDAPGRRGASSAGAR